jgi:hypothetical protein
MTIAIEALFVVQTAADILNVGLDLAKAVGLPVTSWRAGDPTRTAYRYLATVLATLEKGNSSYIKSGFLSTADDDDYLTLSASDVYGVDRVESTSSTPTVTVHNGGGGFYNPEAGDLTFKASSSGATFHCTSGGSLLPGESLTLDLVADVGGSDSTVAVDEVDTLVTTLLGVTVTSSTASVGLDRQDGDSLKQDCRDTRGALSSNGPPDAYEFVVRQSKLTGVSTITKSKSTHDSTTGHVTVYCGGPDGAVDSPSVAAAQTAIETWSTPLCMTPTAVSCTADATAISATISAEDIDTGALARMIAALDAFFLKLPIAGVGGATLRRSALQGEIYKALGIQNAAVTVITPAADATYLEGHVPVRGTTIIVEV